jgi:hypothetical protein
MIGGWIPGGISARIALVADTIWGNREVEIYIRLKIDFLDRQTVQGLRLHILDAIDVGADRILTVGADALLHFRCAERGILPDHRHDRDSDLRKDVGRHRPDCGDTEKKNESCQHIKGMRKSQRESNNAHLLALQPFALSLLDASASPSQRSIEEKQDHPAAEDLLERPRLGEACVSAQQAPARGLASAQRAHIGHRLPRATYCSVLAAAVAVLRQMAQRRCGDVELLS